MKRGGLCVVLVLAACTAPNPSYRARADVADDLAATHTFATTSVDGATSSSQAADGGAPLDLTVATAGDAAVAVHIDLGTSHPADLSSPTVHPDLAATGAAFGECTLAFGLGSCTAICNYFGQTCSKGGCGGATVALYSGSNVCNASPTTSAVACDYDFGATLDPLSALDTGARCCCK